MNGTILLVDDEPAWRLSMRMLLKRKLEIQRIIECNDSREVMGILAKQAIDLVLLDYTMPYLNGEEVLAQIQRKYSRMLKVILLSGQDHQHKERNCMELGVDAIHNKAEGAERILQTVRGALQNCN